MEVKFTVLVPVYNEEANIGNLLRSLAKQRLSVGTLQRIMVVASGCTDKTEEIVKGWMKQDRRVRLLTQKKRGGKAAAINYFLKKDESQVVVMPGGDVVLEDGALENLVRHFVDEKVGMVGARIVSVNEPDTFLGFANRTIWKLHDQMARDHPRLGEVTAWRRVFEELPEETICDEAAIEMLVKEAGLKLVYEPQAVAYNRGPTNWREFMARRRGNHVGHMMVQKQWGEKVASEKGWMIAKYWWRQLLNDKKHWWWYIKLALAELGSKLLATADYYCGRERLVWPMAKSAKKPIEVQG